MTIGLQLPNGMDSTATFAKPVPFIAKPRAKPPATIQMTPQSICCRSFAEMTPEKANTAMGSMATVLALMPICLPKIHNTIVTKNVAPTTTERQLCFTSPSICSSMVF